MQLMSYLDISNLPNCSSCVNCQYCLMREEKNSYRETVYQVIWECIWSSFFKYIPLKLKKLKQLFIIYKSKNYFDQTLNIFFFHSALIPTISTHFEKKKTHIFFKVRWPCPKIYALWTFFFKVRCNKPQHHINSLLFITVNNICTKLNR